MIKHLKDAAIPQNNNSGRDAFWYYRMRLCLILIVKTVVSSIPETYPALPAFKHPFPLDLKAQEKEEQVHRQLDKGGIPVG